ncbi:MAG: GNAT family N-acetyltransferase [Syntrophobacteraceae bacterium]
MCPTAIDFSIRDASISDLHLLVRIVRESFRDVAFRFGITEANCPRHPSNCTSEWIESALEKGITYFIIERSGIPCGCVAIERARPEVCYLERLGVLPKYRLAGYGHALVDHALEWAWRAGAHRVEIGIISDDIGLKEWYRRIGFTETRRASFTHLPFEVTFMEIVPDPARLLPVNFPCSG